MSDKMILRGGLGEPYCSALCYEEAGTKISTAVIQGITGRCRFCRANVRVTVGSDVKLIPQGSSEFTFFCPDCHYQATEYVKTYPLCCMCGTQVRAFSPDQMQRGRSTLTEMSFAFGVTALIGGLLLGSAIYWRASLSETAAVLLGLAGVGLVLIGLFAVAILRGANRLAEEKNRELSRD